MSVRGEIAAKVFQCMVMGRHADEIADALLPIVERVAYKVFTEISIDLASKGGAEADAIVRRVMEGGQCT